MRYRKFGTTNLFVSEIGFGAWAIGGGAMVGETAIGWGDADDSTSIRSIHTALDRGINFFDTADIYGLGHSEELLGKTIGKNQDLVIATKAGNVARNDQFTVDYSKTYILQACEASLRRLRRDCIDYYQLHTARLAHLEEGACVEAMQQLQQEGKIRYWGISLNTFEPDAESSHLISHRLGSGFQLVLNILNQRALPVITRAAEAGYGIIARMPLQFGLLTGKFDKGFDFTDNDHRKNRITNEIVDATLTATAPIWELCKKYQCSKTALAMSYVLSYPEVSTVIPGIRTPEQAVENTACIIELEASDRLLIESMGKNQFVEMMNMIRRQG